MNEIFKKIDDFIDQIPEDIKDLIQKAAIALGAILALAGILSAIIRGIKDAEPAGFQLVEDSNDLFYLEQLREENEKKRRLIEDVEYDISVLTENKLQNKKLYQPMAQGTLDHLRGERSEKEEFLLPENELRTRRAAPGFLTEEPDDGLLKWPETPTSRGLPSSQRVFQTPSNETIRDEEKTRINEDQTQRNPQKDKIKKDLDIPFVE